MCQRTLFGISLGLLCLYLVTGTNASSNLRLDPPRIVASFGSSISANCSTDVADYLIMGWEAPIGTSEKTGPKMVTWIVGNLTEWDMKPSCFINVRDQPLPEELPLSLTIYKIPDSVSISTVNHTGPMIEGRQYELQCDIQNVAPVGNVTMKWYKGDTQVGNTTFSESSKTPDNLLATLQISPSRDDDGAQYRCKAELDLGPEGPQPLPAVMSDPLNITVHYGPEISCYSGNFTAIRNEEFTPNCTVQGHPTPEITWYKEGVTVSFPKKMDINDAGQYILNASSYTHAIHPVEIQVLYAPFEIKELEKTTINQNYDGVLKCSSVSKPRPQYNWTYPPADNVKVENVDAVSLLHLDYITGHNTGNYTCTAYNHLGETSQSVQVEMGATQTSSASITTVNHSGPMIEGTQYELQCDVQYVAPVQHITVHWYKGTTRLNSQSFNLSQTGNKYQTNLFSTLRVFSNRTDNGAQYKCVAELTPKADGRHRISVTSEPLNITVHYKPVINIEKLPSVVPVFRGYQEVLVCEAEGYPAPTIIWTFKSHMVMGENYTIEEATNENVGLYTCTANNSVNTTIIVVKVILKEDYLPLIAGFVALVVVITSVFFIVIYSIYYKNTKMGRYMVEGAKPNAQNGNVAQNGKDSAIPMKKLSQYSISL
uniref:Intercellular adhesion molecule 3 n=1 Tax=Astyanax mexicanus TaxID=7994 RepID=A0A3B1J5J3_ASTMX